MAKVTITLEDVNGGISVEAEFDPPMRIGKPLSAAQAAAVDIMAELNNEDEESDPDEAH